MIDSSEIKDIDEDVAMMYGKIIIQSSTYYERCFLMDLFSISQLKDKSGISDATIRRYLADFKDFLPEGKRLGRGVKYPVETLQALNNINFWYQSGKSKEEIEENLRMGTPIKSSSPHQKDRFEALTEEIRALNETISEQTKAFTQLTQLVLNAVPNQEQLIESLLNIHSRLHVASQEFSSSDAIHADDISPDTQKTPPEEPIAFEQDLCHTDATTVQEMDISTTKKPYPNNQPLLFEDESPIKANVGTLFEDPPGIDEPEAYRKWIDAVLLELSGDGLSNKEICAELMERGIKTPKGKEAWYPVAVAAMLKPLQSQQDEAGSIDEPETESQIDAIPKQGSPGYDDWLFEKIEGLRAEGMTYGKIEGYLNDNGILTVTGKKWGRNSVYAFFKKRSA